MIHSHSFFISVFSITIIKCIELCLVHEFININFYSLKDEKTAPAYGDDMEESEDEDRVHNAYMEKMKSQRQERDNDGDEDDDESGMKFIILIVYLRWCHRI